VWAIIIMVASIALLKQVAVCALPSRHYRLTLSQQSWFIPFSGTYADGSAFPTDASAQVT
jgi:hypothetical protein